MCAERFEASAVVALAAAPFRAVVFFAFLRLFGFLAEIATIGCGILAEVSSVGCGILAEVASVGCGILAEVASVGCGILT